MSGLFSNLFALYRYVMKKFLARLRRDDEGASLVEYGLLVALIAVACIVAVTLLGSNLATLFNNISGTF